MAIVSLAFAIIGSLMSIKAYVSGNSESTGDKEGGTADSAVDASTSKADAEKAQRQRGANAKRTLAAYGKTMPDCNMLQCQCPTRW